METHDEIIFDNLDWSEKKMPRAEYSNCRFNKCNFTKTEFHSSDFIDCTFKDCNLSLAILGNTGIKTVSFINCKLMGIDFSACNNFLFSPAFQSCQLDYSSFFQKKMKKIAFIDCSMKKVDFTETDLSMSVFKNCDLQETIFRSSILEKTDFRTAVNYAFDPELNKIKKAKFASAGLAGLLYKYNIDID